MLLVVAQPPRELPQHAHGNLRRFLHDAIERGGVDAQELHRTGGACRHFTRLVLEQRHLAEEVADLELRDLPLLPRVLLQELDATAADDEHVRAGVVLLEDQLARFRGDQIAGEIVGVQRFVLDVHLYK